MKDMVNHPRHYTQWRTGEVIRLTRLLPFSAGNAIKYVLRPKKHDYVEDLEKSIWYCRDMIAYPPPRTHYSALDEHEMRRLFLGFAGDLNGAGYKHSALALVAISSAVLDGDIHSDASVSWLMTAVRNLQDQITECKYKRKQIEKDTKQ